MTVTKEESARGGPIRGVRSVWLSAFEFQGSRYLSIQGMIGAGDDRVGMVTADQLQTSKRKELTAELLID